MREVGNLLEQQAGAEEYVGHWGRAILSWCDLFEGRGSSRHRAA